MRRKLIKLLPKRFVVWYKQCHYSKSTFEGMEPSEIFTNIYESNHWSSEESISGPGSDLVQTQKLIGELSKLLKEMGIKSMLDIPCGDFNWMKYVNLQGVNYIGADIVPQLIDEVRGKYTADNIRFEVLNLISDALPKTDMLFVRDCLVHLSFENIYKSIRNMKASGAKYLLTTTFTNHTVNFDIPTGEWRALNLQLEPFNFPEPMLVINENSTEINGRFCDKCMALWEIDKIDIPDEAYKD
ncbi:class I SAM-dependent methyltransferase [Dysgonomonas sp. 25]|uniref:class I SAM-dependent methyltransferase n=1 Tax=Dysgonomonas sp. 25 TaxID=2302933 RepID=UPI0013D5CFFB|nr:class I SAM-dependent methyltransferase [Dysgonomonas sp. 25]NDV70414.1 class I SAM-dependent methyltransferase [Dysgonomonas sp. 25]